MGLDSRPPCGWTVAGYLARAAPGFGTPPSSQPEAGGARGTPSSREGPVERTSIGWGASRTRDFDRFSRPNPTGLPGPHRGPSRVVPFFPSAGRRDCGGGSRRTAPGV